MSPETATLPGVMAVDHRVFAVGDRRRLVLGGLAIGLGTSTAAGIMVVAAAAWMTAASLRAEFNSRARVPTALQMLALANPQDAGASAFSGSRHVLDEPAVTLVFKHPLERADSAPLPPRPVPPPDNWPKPEIADRPVDWAAPQVATAIRWPTDTSEKSSVPQQARSDSNSLPVTGSRTAIYDIAAHTVYLPNGERLEAHSGLGSKLDNPRYVNVRHQGPTPPNVYELKLREQLFHGVRAIRLNPVDDGKMFGRDGMLAHSYMLGPSGQSNGCVAFSNYPAFLRAYLRGEVERLVVVARLPTQPSPISRIRRGHNDRLAFRNQ